MAPKKKNPSAQYAFIGLVIAALACVSSALVGTAKGLIAVGIASFDNGDLLSNILYVSLGLIVIGLAVYAILDPNAVRRVFTGRQARYGSNSLILTIAFIGIIVTANGLAYTYPQSWDLTEDQKNTLAKESLQALATLPQKVTATGYFTADLNSSSADELLLKFKSNSKGKFDYKFVNPDLDPLSARQAGITGNGKILLTMGDRKEIASTASETEITKALICLINPTQRTVYFLQGHGEPSLESAGGDTLSYSVAKSTLESKNYTVNPLNLLVDNKIPDDALSIIIDGPQKPLSDQEVKLLKKYVDNGGSLVVMEDPTISTKFGDSKDPLADYLTSDWAITLNNDVVIDLVNTQNPFQAVSSQYSSTHPITQNLTQNFIVILPQARSISVGQPKDGITLTPIILTTERSWGETNLVAGANPEFDPNTDIPGPLNLAVAGSNSTTKGRVVVFGNSVFATDDIFDAYGNGNIFINSVDWAAEQEDLINITPREATQRTFIPPSQGRLIIMIITTVFVIPGLVVAAGIYSWFARRKRG